ncbi:molybdopterin cofactor-binding domain-containing protein, partial [Mesorhizobium sp. M2D.F.Ca.ET.178.01.1.1]|uniref:molybdopterin cofactor-binding domain-containing protein n=1 Tax=Mesorhizobium sp. M2D.F.Ca.ET.178.01.1.1 TaxID=2563937 RepID=UPI001FE20677
LRGVDGGHARAGKDELRRLAAGGSAEVGDAQAAFASAPVRICAAYNTPREYQAPMEPHGLIARWEGDHLTVWEPSQWLDGMARTYAEWFAVPFENVRLVSPYVG